MPTISLAIQNPVRNHSLLEELHFKS